jgi:hypothetical protein
LPNALPMMMPTAMSTTLPRMAKSLNSLISDMGTSGPQHTTGRTEARGKSAAFSPRVVRRFAMGDALAGRQREPPTQRYHRREAALEE